MKSSRKPFSLMISGFTSKPRNSNQAFVERYVVVHGTDRFIVDITDAIPGTGRHSSISQNVPCKPDVGREVISISGIERPSGGGSGEVQRGIREQSFHRIVV